jgi:hypothetical protein
MKHDEKSPSLHPYLEQNQPHFYLKIGLKTEDPAELEKIPFPFYLVSDSDPLIRYHEGQFVTDSGSAIQKVFLLVQRDQYLVKKDELRPILNPNIDAGWQKGFSFHSRGGKDSSLLLLANQTSKDDRLVPFQPLFFCKTRKAYFSPPCPSCGSPLEQCYDDVLLAEKGLQPYSTSLRRYLFCPSCSTQDPLYFFVYALESADPPGLRDSSALIQEFGKLVSKESPASSIPCASCERLRACYGADRLALSRIVPFSFYPFYALIFEAPSIQAADFLSLLSGATFGELEARLKSRGEPGRIACLRELNAHGVTQAPALYEDDDRNFLEVLYLKLSFLGELIQSFLAGQEISKHPDLRPSLDRIWVNLEEPSGLLPVFWNFRVRLIDLFWNPTGSPPSPPASETFYFLGLSWFYALLVNSKQDMGRVSLSLEETMSRFSAGGSGSPSPARQESFNDTFLPENIFWNPGGKRVNPAWNSFWERSLQLGWQLLQAGWKEPPWAAEGLRKDLEAIRQDIRKRLFSAGPMEAVPAAQPQEQEAIAGILLRILGKWRQQAETGKEGPREAPSIPAEKKSRAEGVPETVILSGGKTPRESSVPSAPQRKIEEVAETVIQSPGQASRPSMQPSAPGKGKGASFRDQGQISKEKTPSPKDETPPGDDFMQETVIITPEKLKELGKKVR